MTIRFMAAIAATGLLVGCSWYTVQLRDDGPAPRSDAAAAPTEAAPAETRTLRPGPSPVIVQAVRATAATIAWKSPWRGESRVHYAPTPDLAGNDACSASAAGEATRVTLAGLTPHVRYFFRVETRSPLGVSRSPILSFVTAR